MKQAAGILSQKLRFPSANTILLMTVLAQGSGLSSRQDAVYILVGLSMEANANNTTKGQGFIGTKLLPDNPSSAVRSGYRRGNPWDAAPKKSLARWREKT